MSSERDPRIYFAGERTMLAWIRTGLAMMGFGFVVARFGLFLRELAVARGEVMSPSGGGSLWVGTALVLLGVVVNVYAAISHARFAARFHRGESERHEVGAPAGAMWIDAIGISVVGVGVVIAILLYATR